MTEFVSQVFEAVTLGSVLTSALLGILMGAFYGYYLSPNGPPLYPWPLLFIGISFVLAFGAWAYFSGAPFQPAYQLGRAILWTVTVSALPIGRLGRAMIADRFPTLRRVGIPETRDQREDRQFGDERRTLERQHRMDE
jgi:hypothetical protein